MSVPVMSGEEIRNSPLNNSISKQRWTFSRAERFPKIKSGGDSYTIYNLPSMKTTRYTTMGRGNKSDFTKNDKSVTAMFYNTARDFDPKNVHGPCFSFGEGRDKYEHVYCETNKTIDREVPGPGKYNYLVPFGKGSRAFSIKGRYEKGSGGYIVSDAPGPGTYPITLKINDKGKYFSSRMRNVSSCSFGASKTQRFNYKYNGNPGPNAYNIKTLMGENFDSKFKSTHGRTIMGRIKPYDSRSNYPGPGMYRCFSEFGIYENKKAWERENGVRSVSKNKKSSKKTLNKKGVKLDEDKHDLTTRGSEGKKGE